LRVGERLDPRPLRESPRADRERTNRAEFVAVTELTADAELPLSCVIPSVTKYVPA
jgi:hypothetical protein